MLHCGRLSQFNANSLILWHEMWCIILKAKLPVLGKICAKTSQQLVHSLKAASGKGKSSYLDWLLTDVYVEQTTC